MAPHAPGELHVPGYRAERLLAHGRHAAVWLAHEVRSGRPVALKLARTRQAREQLAREHGVLSLLQHRHVVEVLAHGRSAQGDFLAMEHAVQSLAGSTLPLPDAQVHRLMLQAAEALATWHARGWVHRDVKLANLLLRADGSLALADAGSACATGEGAAVPGTVTGTPRYAAPEQTQGAPADPTADVYSLGVCLYELCCGTAPFPGETLAEAAAQHLCAPVPTLPAPRAHWQPLLQAMLAKRPAGRPADGRAVLALLRRIEPGAIGATGDMEDPS